ncbi:cytochrome C oxidase subunit IV family protein [Natronosalvus rutilus]|uniref:Cytochrome C oxidase subunit IV family protein n=1 Tax=Natronosalvus rutilus TaxID=2953753 RepID=A0A9E7SUY9_9EURY|nr:cytochrome C oxidase subunit IV family protein [Natronosalvus rutilus]UTF55314.1 cytochrome C oxidase subunit IV family protein [Natronosalvus rutilus]
MSSVRTYTIIYVLLLSLGTAKFVFFELPWFTYEFAVGATLFLAVIKSLLISGWYQHLVDEPRSITYVMLSAVFMVFLLAVAAGFSIQ